MLAVYRLSILSIPLMMPMPPMAVLAEKASGYENYKKAGETSELARAVQKPIADLISVSFQNNTNFNSCHEQVLA